MICRNFKRSIAVSRKMFLNAVSAITRTIVTSLNKGNISIPVFKSNKSIVRQQIWETTEKSQL